MLAQFFNLYQLIYRAVRSVGPIVAGPVHGTQLKGVLNISNFSTSSTPPYSLRRPRPMRVQDIGAWFYILSLIGQLAVLTNALVIAFTSNFIERTFFQTQFSQDGSVKGFTEFSLSKFNVRDFVNETRPVGEQVRN